MTEPTIPPGSSIDGDVFTGGKRVANVSGDYYEGVAPVGVAALHQLPAPPGDFTGRTAELAELRQAVKEQGAAISGLRGLGGVGKTALALTLAHELKADYRDAQIFLDLQGVTQPLAPAAVMAHVIRAYQPLAKLPDDPAQLAAIYRSVLDGQRALLLLDNADNAEQIKPLVPPPGCLLIVTSRQKFTLPGLKPINLDSLPPADAQALLLKLAPRIQGLASDIAKQCGCLPLALALAGSALAEREDLEPAAYLRRLEQARLTVLDDVEASITLSYNLLSAELQPLWCVLGVFPGDFDAPAAAAVWELGAEPASERLSDLLKYSLLEFNAANKRYRLHDLARDFCRARLSEAGHNASFLRLVNYYSELVALADGLSYQNRDTSLKSFGAFDIERGNILAIHEWTVTHWRNSPLVATALTTYAGAGRLLSLHLPPSERVALYQTAIDAAVSLGEKKAQASLLLNLGMAHIDLEQPTLALPSFEASYSIAQELNEHTLEIQALTNMGIAFDQMDDPRRGIDYSQIALAMSRRHGNRHSEALNLGNIALCYGHLAAIEQTEAYLAQSKEFLTHALPIFHEIGDLDGEGNTLNILGSLHQMSGEFRLAKEYFDNYLPIARKIGDRRGEGNALWNKALALERLGDRPGAVANAKAALIAYEEMEVPRTEYVRQKIAEWEALTNG